VNVDVEDDMKVVDLDLLASENCWHLPSKALKVEAWTGQRPIGQFLMGLHYERRLDYAMREDG